MLNDTALPPPASALPSALADVVAIAHNVVQAQNGSAAAGPTPLVQTPGVAAGDPASLGVAVLLANWTGVGQSDGLDYGTAARAQLEYLLNDVPRTSDGAISHRADEVQLWCVRPRPHRHEDS